MTLHHQINTALAEQWGRTAQPKIALMLPFPPSVNSLWKHGGRTGVYRSPRYMLWLNVAGQEINRQRPGCITGAYKIKLVLGRPDRKKRDQENCLKAVSDLLVAHRVVEDDSKAVSTTVEWSDHLDGCKVTLTAARQVAA